MAQFPVHTNLVKLCIVDNWKCSGTSVTTMLNGYIVEIGFSATVCTNVVSAISRVFDGEERSDVTLDSVTFSQ